MAVSKKSIYYTKMILALLFLMTFIAVAVAEEPIKTNEQEQDEYEYNNLVAGLSQVTNIPVVSDKYIVFTQNFGVRFTGIAFDFEGYKIIHPFQNKINTDFADNVTSRLMFFVLLRNANPVLKDSCRIRYKLIIDGLWSVDPNNPNKEYDLNTGLSVSYIDITGNEALPPVTKVDGNKVTFIYAGNSNQRVRLSGSFCAWDSWIYTLKEMADRPGFYSTTLTLPRGKYEYSYYIGMQSVVDKTNSKRIYTTDGRTLSVITVE